MPNAEGKSVVVKCSEASREYLREHAKMTGISMRRTVDDALKAWLPTVYQKWPKDLSK